MTYAIWKRVFEGETYYAIASSDGYGLGGDWTFVKGYYRTYEEADKALSKLR